MNIRLKAYLISIPQFISFSLISIFLFLLLFHIAILSLPVLAFIWTFWGFSIFTVLTGVKLQGKHILTFAFLNLLFSASVLALVISNIELFKFSALSIFILCVIVSIAVLYIFVLIKTGKIYRPLVKEEFQKLFRNP